MANQVALITGSASGIGKRTAEELAAQDIDLIINYRNSKQQAFELSSYLSEKFHIRVLPVQADISNPDDCSRLVAKALEKFGTIDILINNAGPYIHERKTLIEYSLDEWTYLMNGNLNSVFYLCKEIIPVMRKNKWGRIINIGYERAETAPGWAYRSAFAAAKAGLVSLTRTLAIEEFPFGITVNIINPGDIRGEWKESNIHHTKRHENLAATFSKQGTGQDIARVIAFLIDPHSDLITGSVIPVSGAVDVLSKSNQMYYEKFQAGNFFVEE